MLGLIVIAVVLAIKRWRSIWPGTLIAIVFVGILLTVFHLDSRGVQVVGSVSGSLPPLHLPKWELWHQIGTLAPAALAITILGLMEAISISQSIADQIRERGGGIYFSGINQRVFDVLIISGLLNDIGHSHTGAVIRLAMRESFCPVIFAAAEGLFERQSSLQVHELPNGAIFVRNAPAGQRIPFYVCFGHMIEILNHEIEKHH